jgi:hypothetical protein
MASRLGLGRIIEWAKNVDAEELEYVIIRLGKIRAQRMEAVLAADAHGKGVRIKRARKAKGPMQDAVNKLYDTPRDIKRVEPSAADLDATVAEKETAIAAS